MIYNQASGVVNNNSMTEVEVTTFNQKFEQYLGEKVRGANVNSLINAVNTNNLSTDDTSKQVTLTSETKSGDTYPKNKKTGSTYKVEVTKYTKGGLIQEIKITENT